MTDAELLLEARYLAKDEGKTFTALVHDALQEYIERHRKPRQLPDWVGVRRILTLDRRHFGIIRPRHCDAFTLLP